jgi:hypothetical protein
MRTRRLLGGPLAIVLTFALYLAAFVQITAAQSQCQLTIDPEVATAGSEFHLHGSGFTPTQLILQKEGEDPVTIDLDLGTADPFDIPIGSRKGDEGNWTATAALPGTCSPSVTFIATLESTDAISDLLAAPKTNDHLPLMVVLLTIVAGFGAGAVVALRLRRS